MKQKITVKNITKTLMEVRVEDISGLANFNEGKWEISPNIRQHSDEILKVLVKPGE